MKLENAESIGKILKLHGYKGNLTVFVDPQYQELFEDQQTAFIDFEFGNLIPYTIEELAIGTKNRYFIKFNQVKSEEQARKLVGKKIYTSKEEIEAFYGETEDMNNEFVGFIIQNPDRKELGKISSIIEHPHQVLLELESGALIPFNQDFVSEIIDEERIIIMDLPDGLLDL
ncbi:MAG: ribosome maturation factor RimM [Flavobacteriales bacterium]|nr:ribosome maturation factor RimM [Flavobacteriales bacterium]